MRNFHHKMDLLQNTLISMFANCESLLQDSIQYLNDNTQAINFEQKEYNIRKIGKQIEDNAMDLLVCEQPVAKDLRILSTTFKMVYDLKRISTQILEISNIYSILNDKQLFISMQINKMAKSTMELFSVCVDSITFMDIELIDNILSKENDIDILFTEVKKLIINGIKNSNEHQEDYINLIMIAKYFEKIGDHCVNIAKSQYFCVVGDDLARQ